MATYYFNTDGSIANINQGGPDVAFIGNLQVQTVNATDLRKFAAIVYSESSFWGLVQQIAPANPFLEMQRETFGITFTMFTYARAKNAAMQRAGKSYTFHDMLGDKNYTHGIGSTAYNEFLADTGGDERRRKAVVLAVMRLFLGPQYQQDMQDVIVGLDGAVFWDGNDLFRLFKSHYRAKQGFELSNPAHGAIYQNVSVVKNAQVITSSPASNPNVIAANRQYTFMSTMTLGGTIFFKIHPQAAAQGVGV
ncbi:MAG: hypothetical protein NW226_11065 [Microscillaceae bacterium]|nr:hypothetical protein [Microscillaceae bacterium]